MTSVAPKSRSGIYWAGSIPYAEFRRTLWLAGAEAPTAGTLPPRVPEGSVGRTETNLGAGFAHHRGLPKRSWVISWRDESRP